MLNKKSNELETQVNMVIDQYRAIILDSLEQEYGELESWPYTRRKVLKALGDRGLASRIIEIISRNLGCIL